MRVGSLFAGIGGFDLGFERAGFSVAWHAEIDKAASRILAYHWPTVPNLGDVTKIDGASIEPVDVICGGFPCQDLSVAGKRAGFTGKRSVLAFEFLRIVAEMREATNGSAPTFIVLENVPGLFSSSAGRDFAALLDALADLRPLDIAWRVLDSRYFNVAQRRERVFVVVDFGGERCDEILALSEGLRGDSPKSRAKGQDVAGTLGGGADDGVSSRGGHGEFVEGPGTLTARAFKDQDFLVAGWPAGIAPTLNAHFVDKQGLEDQHALNGAGLFVPVASGWQQGGATQMGMGLEGVPPVRSSQTLTIFNDVAPTLTSTNDPSRSPQSSEVTQQVEACLTAGAGVRRLTPRECERLQGFPDDWTGIPSMADGPRYKCLGNAVTVNVAEWIARRIA